MKARFRVGCVPYVNARPLVACFDQPNEFVEVVYDVPSRLPAMLDSGEVDAILVSSIEYLRRDDLVIAADVGIMSNGPVASVRMLSKVPLEKIQTLALDESSMTSNMLAQIILAERGVRPSLVTMEPDQGAMLTACDACVLIGDKGLEADGTGLVDVDLGAAWTELTGEGFTWALWLSRRDQFENPVWYERDQVEQLALLLQYGYESSGFAWLHEYMTVSGTRPLLCDGPGEDTWVRRDIELKERSDRFEGRRDWIISEAATKSNWSELKTREYLTHNVRFKLGGRSGLNKFAALLQKHGFLAEIVEHDRRREYSSSLIHSIYALNPASELKE
jgi:predicted solute-binding protein